MGAQVSGPRPQAFSVLLDPGAPDICLSLSSLLSPPFPPLSFLLLLFLCLFPLSLSLPFSVSLSLPPSLSLFLPLFFPPLLASVSGREYSSGLVRLTASLADGQSTELELMLRRA